MPGGRGLQTVDVPALRQQGRDAGREPGAPRPRLRRPAHAPRPAGAAARAHPVRLRAAGAGLPGRRLPRLPLPRRAGRAEGPRPSGERGRPRGQGASGACVQDRGRAGRRPRPGTARPPADAGLRRRRRAGRRPGGAAGRRPRHGHRRHPLRRGRPGAVATAIGPARPPAETRTTSARPLGRVAPCPN
ncbi:hypothetical protein SGPA1_40848 [Streptomyces misionensis JCM 4497]